MVDKSILLCRNNWTKEAIDLLFLLDELEQDDYDTDTQEVILKSRGYANVS